MKLLPHQNHKLLNEKKKQGIREIMSPIIPVFLKHKGRLAIGFVSLLCVDFLQLAIPRILKHGIDSLEQGSATVKTLLLLSGSVLLIGIGAAFFRFCWRYFIIGFSRILEHNVRQQLYRHILSLDRSFFDKKTTGDIMAHASNDLNAIQMACGMGLVAAVDALVVSLAAIGFMAHINLKLTLIALLPMPFLILTTRIMAKHLHHRFDKVQHQFSLLTEFARSAIVSIRLIKAYSLEKQQTSQFTKLGDQYRQTNLQVAIIQGILVPAAMLVGNAGMLTILFFGGYLTIKQSISIGDFVAFVTYLQMLIWPMMAIGWVTNITQRGLTSMRRINILLNAVSTLSLPQIQHNETKTTSTKNPDSKAIFTFNQLNFSYPDKTNPTLKNITFATDKKIIAISGRTGSGKSTLCKLLMRVYAVDNQKLFLNGNDVNNLKPDFVRSHIAYVSQEPILFSETLAANIQTGNQHATDQEIIDAAKAASLHEDILQFPLQYQALIGEKGVSLSGGQRQRLAIARALISKRPLLLLDDVFSTVDVETEQNIISGILNYFKGITIIFVSNRQKLLTIADEILFLENGSIKSRGSHNELIKNCEPYKSMVRRQVYLHSTETKNLSTPTYNIK